MLVLQVVESRAKEGSGGDGTAIRVSTLNLVDLAGSERIAKTGGWYDDRENTLHCCASVC
jgi:hypothetical protein